MQPAVSVVSGPSVNVTHPELCQHWGIWSRFRAKRRRLPTDFTKQWGFSRGKYHQDVWEETGGQGQAYFVTCLIVSQKYLVLGCQFNPLFPPVPNIRPGFFFNKQTNYATCTYRVKKNPFNSKAGYYRLLLLVGTMYYMLVTTS